MLHIIEPKEEKLNFTIERILALGIMPMLPFPFVDFLVVERTFVITPEWLKSEERTVEIHMASSTWTCRAIVSFLTSSVIRLEIRRDFSVEGLVCGLSPDNKSS